MAGSVEDEISLPDNPPGARARSIGAASTLIATMTAAAAVGVDETELAQWGRLAEARLCLGLQRTIRQPLPLSKAAHFEPRRALLPFAPRRFEIGSD
jgi:hypothetical protein